MAPEPAPRSRRLVTFLIVGPALSLYVVLAVTSMRTKSATFDEPAHLVAGYTHLRFQDYRLVPDHPPLVHKLAALPLRFLDVHFRTNDATWDLGRQWELGRRFLYRWNDADRLLFWSRVSVVPLGCALAMAVFLWTRRLWGLASAGTALFLCVLNPDVLAHGQLVTTDMGLTLFLFLSVVAFERLTERATWPRLLATGLAVGAAFATKLSALVLIPILIALALVVLFSAEPMRVELAPRVRVLAGRRHRALWLLLILCAVALVALFVVWSSYDFHFPTSADAAVRERIPWSRLEPENPVLARGADLMRRFKLLPEAYLWGFLRFFKHQQSRPAFLLGQHSDRGFWYFFPVSFALKTPLALLLLLGVAALTFRRTHVGRRSELFLFLPVLLYAGIALTRGINIGHRHLLPIAPFLFVAAGRSAAWARGSWPRKGPLLLLCCLAGWYASAAVRIHPHYLAYFNELAGGPSNGYKLLVDSSLDWGQDLKGLKTTMERRGIPWIKLSYFGTADPEYYGIPCDLLPGYLPPLPHRVARELRPGDLLAISATNLQGVYLDPEVRPLLERLRGLDPIGHVGYSILLYRVDFSWVLPAHITEPTYYE